MRLAVSVRVVENTRTSRGCRPVSGAADAATDASCPCSDLANGADGALATSSSGSQYSGSRVETPVSYAGEDDDEDEDLNENEGED